MSKANGITIALLIAISFFQSYTNRVQNEQIAKLTTSHNVNQKLLAGMVVLLQEHDKIIRKDYKDISLSR